MNADRTPSNDGTNGAEVRQFLTFVLNEEEFAIDILQIQEIREMSKITPIPNAPVSVRGVMNLRGSVIPVVDLRTRFSMAEVAAGSKTIIIVVNVGLRVAGLVVDAVSDVMTLPMRDVEPTPAMTGASDTAFILGLAKVEQRLITLLNIEDLMTPETLVVFETTAA